MKNDKLVNTSGKYSNKVNNNKFEEEKKGDNQIDSQASYVRVDKRAKEVDFDLKRKDEKGTQVQAKVKSAVVDAKKEDKSDESEISRLRKTYKGHNQ